MTTQALSYGALMERTYYRSIESWRDDNAPGIMLQDLHADHVLNTEQQAVRWPNGLLHVVVMISGRRHGDSASFFYKFRRIESNMYLCAGGSIDLNPR